jgi:hypothetical protein
MLIQNQDLTFLRHKYICLTVLATNALIEFMKWISIFTTIFALLLLAACDVVRGQDFRTDGWLEDFCSTETGNVTSACQSGLVY